jgi:hypothetical protein
MVMVCVHSTTHLVFLLSLGLSDTSAAFFANWTSYWLDPLMKDERFNGELFKAVSKLIGSLTALMYNLRQPHAYTSHSE